MSVDHHPGADNIACLRQGIELIRSLDDRAFRQAPEGLQMGGVGAQFRHCIDFYFCFLRGLGAGRVDYDRRERDPRLETERMHAVERLEAIAERLEAITPARARETVEVRSDPGAGDDGPGWCASTIARELQFLLSHTIHHYALIVSLLKLQGIGLGADYATFGVAPSTLRYWKETGTYAG